MNKIAVAAHRDMALAIRDKVAALVKQGKTADAIVAAKPTSGYDDNVEQASMTSERFIRALVAELSAP